MEGAFERGGERNRAKKREEQRWENEGGWGNKVEKRGRSPQAQFLRNANGARSTFLLYRSRETRPFKPSSIDKEISARVPWDYVVPVLVNSPAVL